MDNSLTELYGDNLQHRLDSHSKLLQDININKTIDIYLQIKEFRHFRQKSHMTSQLKELTKYRKKLQQLEISIQDFKNQVTSTLPNLTSKNMIESLYFIEDLLNKNNFILENKNNDYNNLFSDLKQMEEKNPVEMDNQEKQKFFIFKIWDKLFLQKENKFLKQLFSQYIQENQSNLSKIQENQIIKDLLQTSLQIFNIFYLQTIKNEKEKIDVLANYIYNFRKKTTVFQIVFKFLFKIDKGIKIYKQPYQNFLILFFLLMVNFIQIQPYYSFSNDQQNFIDFLKYDEYSFFSNLYLNVLFFYLTLCYVMFLKYMGSMSRIFSYQKFFLSCFIYYGMDIKRHSIIANWNTKSNILDLNVEIIILYIYLAMYLMFQKIQNFLKRFHNIKNRNKILRYHDNVMRQLKNKFIPVLINNILNIGLLIFFYIICKNFQVNISEIFMPFIVLQFQNIGILLYFIMVQVVKKKQGLSQVKIFEISYLILKAYCFFVYIGIFLYKVNLIVVYHKGHFIIEEVFFVLVIVGMAVLNFNEFWIKYFVFKKNLKFKEKTFEEEQTCPICWEKTNQGIHTDCNHYFHQECLFNWFENNAWNSINCPICRQEF